MRVDVYHHQVSGDGIGPMIERLQHSLHVLHTKLEAIMATLDQVLAEVTDENTRLDSIQALIDGIKQQLADALSGTTLPPPVQEKVDAVFAGLTANKAKIDRSLNVNVPPAPPVP